MAQCRKIITQLRMPGVNTGFLTYWCGLWQLNNAPACEREVILAEPVFECRISRLGAKWHWQVVMMILNTCWPE